MPLNYEADGLMVTAPDGIGAITEQTDLARVVALVAATVDWPDGSRGLRPGDVVIITSKVVAKAEGRVRPATQRTEAQAAETQQVVARIPGGTVIARTHHGLVLAGAGIDESNTADGTIVLLPSDPDGSARRLRRDLEQASDTAPLAVIITDTLGRAWRLGQTDTAIGVAGLDPLQDLAGAPDTAGRPLSVTAPAVADEIAAAADLVKGKVSGRPVAFVRGLAHLVTAEPGPGAAALIRPPAEDLFSEGTAEARQAGMRAAVRCMKARYRACSRPRPTPARRCGISSSARKA